MISIGNIKCISLLAIFCVFLGMTKLTNAATYYVDSSIIDTNVASANPDFTSYNHITFAIAGGSDSVYKTLADVNLKLFSPGDNIYFRRGDTWGDQLLIPSSGAPGNPITFGAYGTGNKPVFDGDGVDLNEYHGLVRGDSKDFIIVSDIRVQNVGVGDADENSGIGFFGGDHIVIQDCEVSYIESAGIKINTSSNVAILRNEVTLTNLDSASEQISLSGVNGFEVAYNRSYTNGDQGRVIQEAGGAGIDSKGGSRNGTIHHNEVWDIHNGSVGIYVDAFDQETYNIEIYSNYVHDVGTSGISIGSEAGGALYDVLVHHNIIENAAWGGITMHNIGAFGGAVSGIRFYNNTLYQNGTNGIDWLGGVRIFDQMLATAGVTFKNNIFAGSYNFQIGYDVDYVEEGDIVMSYNVISGGNANSGNFTAISGANAITGNPASPLFTDATGNNFTLQSGAPAIDSCDNSAWQDEPNITDYKGTVITNENGDVVAPGGRVDCGAIEYSASGDTTPPAAPTALQVR